MNRAQLESIIMPDTAPRFYFLGLPRVEYQGQVEYFPSAKAAALIAYLVLHPQPQSREKIIALFWSESAEDAARKNLRNTLWAIRKLCGDVINTDNNCLSLTIPLWTDVQAVLSGQQSGAGCGDFLEALRLTEAPDIEVWITQVRMQIDALEDQPAQPRLTSKVTIARIDPPLDSVSQNARNVPINRTWNAHTALPFVGRESERGRIDSELQTVMRGHARIVALTGELGIGKSRLAAEWLDALPTKAHHVVLQTRCLQSAQHLPLAPLIDLFGTKLCRTHIANLVPDLANPPIWLAEIAILFPEIAEVAAQLQGKPSKSEPVDLGEMADRCTTIDHRAEQSRLFEAFAQLVITMFDRIDSPSALILVIDDLHWADAALINWLDYLFARLSDKRLLLLTTIRTDLLSNGGQTGSLSAMLAAWQRSDVLTMIRLPRLTLDEAARLVELLGVGSLRSYQVRMQSDGNPYFLVELARAPDDQLPPTLYDLLSARLNMLTLSTRKTLGAAAVLEGDFTFDHLLRLTHNGESEVLDALDQLLESDVLYERKMRYYFTHPLLQVVALEQLSSARRDVLTREANALLEEERAPQRSLIELFPYVSRKDAR